MEKFFTFALMVAILAPLGQCQTFRRITSEDGTVKWELKLEDKHVGKYPDSLTSFHTNRVAASGMGQTIGKTYTPVTYRKGPTRTYEKKPLQKVTPTVYGTPDIPVSRTHYQSRYQPSYYSAVKTPTTYNRPVPSTVRVPIYRAGNVAPSVYNKNTEATYFRG